MTQIDQTRSQPDYEATLTVRDNKYFLYIHELQLIAQADNLDSAYNELNRIKDERIKSFEMAGMLDKLPTPLQNLQQKEKSLKRKDMGLFILKTLVAGFMLVLIINFASTKMSNALTAAPKKIKYSLKELPRQIALELEYQLHNLTDTEVSQERGKKIRSSLRALGKDIKPYLDEFKHGLSETDLDKEFRESANNQ